MWTASGYIVNSLCLILTFLGKLQMLYLKTPLSSVEKTFSFPFNVVILLKHHFRISCFLFCLNCSFDLYFDFWFSFWVSLVLKLQACSCVSRWQNSTIKEHVNFFPAIPIAIPASAEVTFISQRWYFLLLLFPLWLNLDTFDHQLYLASKWIL